MAQEIFKRYEKKYILDETTYRYLFFRLAEKMSPDSYGEHTISNVYFDTPEYELIRRSIEKPIYKEKVRLRAYGKVKADSTVFAELKKEYDGVVYKRRAEMTLAEAYEYLYRGRRTAKDSQILSEIGYSMNFYGLVPMAYVAYDRTALFGKENSELRVTFDRKIRCRDWDLCLDHGDGGVPVLPPGKVLMEVKIPGAMPVWMSRLFSELEIFPTSFSKYGTFYKMRLCGQLGGERCA